MRIYDLLTLSIIGIVLAIVPPMAWAQEPDSQDVVPSESQDVVSPPSPEEIIERIESYLNSFETLRARFLQVSAQRNVIRGNVYLSRPGRMRVAYDPPVNDYIVSDGFALFYWDDELKQESSTLLSESLASIILRSDIMLSGDVTVISLIYNPSENEIAVTLIDTDEPDQGQLTLVFHNQPIGLKQWTVVDAQRTITHIILLDVETDIELNEWLFVFTTPEE